MKVQRNEKCPCGSGKKYKNCCLQKDLEKEKFELEHPTTKYEVGPEPKFATWKIFALGFLGLGVIGLIFGLVFGLPQLGSAIFGIGLVALILFCAFRNEPTVRKRTGDGGNIDFGNRS